MGGNHLFPQNQVEVNRRFRRTKRPSFLIAEKSTFYFEDVMNRRKSNKTNPIDMPPINYNNGGHKEGGRTNVTK